MTDFRCSEASLARAEPMFATATHVSTWLLVEQHGPFSAEAIPAGRLGREALRHLSRLASSVRGRLVLIRRPPGLPIEDGLRVFQADVRPGHERLASMLVPGEAALTELTFDDPGWQTVVDGIPSEGIYLVCTHGKHDPCCAVFGRPVVAGLSDALAPGRVWETSHVGGDRFAPNVIALPSGLYLGRVEPEEASTVVDVVDGGHVPVHYLRGRSCVTAPGQAAQHFARTVGGYAAYDGIGDLLPYEVTASTDDGTPSWTVLLNCPIGDVRVVVRRVNAPEQVQLTCHVEALKTVPGFELVELQPLSAG
jgi:hypothetical protein